VISTVTTNFKPLLWTPPTVTTTGPVVAPSGTGTTISVSDQDLGTEIEPVNVTVLDPWLAPNPVPRIVTSVPTGPLPGLKLEMIGAAEASAPRADIKTTRNIPVNKVQA
jgi:hypothetical protein